MPQPDDAGWSPDPYPNYKHSKAKHGLVHQAAGMHCGKCERTIDAVAAMEAAYQHVLTTGHTVLVDYRARYKVTAVKEKT